MAASKINIQIEKTSKGFTLWVNAEAMRDYSKRGHGVATSDAGMIMRVLHDLGYETNYEDCNYET